MTPAVTWSQMYWSPAPSARTRDANGRKRPPCREARWSLQNEWLCLRLLAAQSASRDALAAQITLIYHQCSLLRCAHRSVFYAKCPCLEKKVQVQKCNLVCPFARWVPFCKKKKNALVLHTFTFTGNVNKWFFFFLLFFLDSSSIVSLFRPFPGC